MPTASAQGASSAVRSTVVTVKYSSATAAPASAKRPPWASSVLSSVRAELKADHEVDGRHRHAQREVPAVGDAEVHRALPPDLVREVDVLALDEPLVRHAVAPLEHALGADPPRERVREAAFARDDGDEPP